MRKKLMLFLFLCFFVVPIAATMLPSQEDEYSIEDFTIRTTPITVPTSKLKLDKPLTIIQFSDLHISPWVGPEEVQSLVDIINLLPKDIIIFTGDLIDANFTYPGDLQEFIPILSQLSAPLGKYAVLGNHDVTRDRLDISSQLLTDSSFDTLNNESVEIEFNNQSFNIVGLIDYGSEHYSTEILNSLLPNTYNIVLNHRPDLIESYLDANFDLQLSGHSHGGQIVINQTPLATTPFGSKYIDGLYTFEGSKQLLVNRGIGYSRVPIRLNSPSTIDIIILSN